MGLDEAGLFKQEATLFLSAAPEEMYFFGEEATSPSAAADDVLTFALGFFEAGLYGRSWTESNYIRVEIHP